MSDSYSIAFREASDAVKFCLQVRLVVSNLSSSLASDMIMILHCFHHRLSSCWKTKPGPKACSRTQLQPQNLYPLHRPAKPPLVDPIVEISCSFDALIQMYVFRLDSGSRIMAAVHSNFDTIMSKLSANRTRSQNTSCQKPNPEASKLPLQKFMSCNGMPDEQGCVFVNEGIRLASCSHKIIGSSV